MRSRGHRKVSGLKWARELEAKPTYIPVSRPRGVKAFGTRYEKILHAELGPGWLRGRWFEYEDANGLGCCQVDFMGVQGRLWLLETKYTWTPEGHEQLEELYAPVVARARGVEESSIGLVLVCKNLTARAMQAGRVVESLNLAMATARPGTRTILQWLPGTPVWVSPPMQGVTVGHASATP